MQLPELQVRKQGGERERTTPHLHISFLLPYDCWPRFAIDFTQLEEDGQGVLVIQSIVVNPQDKKHQRMANDGSERARGQWRKTGRVTLR